MTALPNHSAASSDLSADEESVNLLVEPPRNMLKATDFDFKLRDDSHSL